MQLTVKMRLNDRQEITTTFDGKDLSEVVLKAGPLLDFNGECGLCKGNDIQLRTRIAGDSGQFRYTEFICRSCGAKRQMGKHKADDSMFLKSAWEPKYVAPSEDGPKE